MWLPSFHGRQRHLHDSGKRRVLLPVKLVQPEPDLIEILPRPETAEQPIPDRKKGAVVRVGLRLPATVVELVHARRHDDEAEGPIQRRREGDVGVMELNHRKHHRLVEQQFPDVDAEKHDEWHARSDEKKISPT